MADNAALQRARLARLSDTTLYQVLVAFLREAVARALQIRPDEVRADSVNADPVPLFLAVRHYVSDSLALPLLSFDLPHCHSIAELAAHLVTEIRTPPAPAASLGVLDFSAGSGSDLPDRRFDAPLERPVLFVLSAPRSGSTLLSAMLGRHSKLYAAGELFLLPFESMGARLRSLGQAGAWLRIALFAAVTELTGMPPDEAEQVCLRLEAEDVAVSTVYRRLQELAGNRIVVDKSPAYAARPDWLACAERVFQAPRYIHLTRDPGAVIESFVRMRFHRMLSSDEPEWDENPWLFGEKVWTRWNANCVRFLAGVAPDRQLRVSYEALVTDPSAEMTRICESLQIPVEAGPLQPYSGGNGGRLGMGDSRFASHTAIEPSLATAWRRSAPPRRFSPTTRALAETLGYAAE